MNKRRRSFRFRIVLGMLGVAAIYLILLSALFFHMFSSMEKEMVNSYRNMLSMYVAQLRAQFDNANTYMNNLAADFDINMLSIQEEDTDEYLLTKFRVYRNIRANYVTIDLLDSLYLYDERNGEIFGIPDDKGHYEEVLEQARTWENRWYLDQEQNVFYRPCKIGNNVWVIGFVPTEQILSQMRQIAVGNGLGWSVTWQESGGQGDSYVLGADGQEMGWGDAVIAERYEGMGMEFCLVMHTGDVWKQNVWFLSFLAGTVLLAAAALLWVMRETRRRFLAPLNLLMKGMQEFADGSSAEPIRGEGEIEPELEKAIHIFNYMVYQIENHRFLIYEQKLEKQKLLIQNMQQQINPHFFSNTMNLIYNLIASGRNELAQTCVLRLGSYYRYMTGIGQEKTTLEQEFRFVSDYLEIMKLRFPHKLDIAVERDRALAELLIPPMLIQPLAENAVKYGFSDRSKHFVLRVTACVQGEEAVLCVEDSGKGFPEEYRGSFDQDRELPGRRRDGKEHVGLWNVAQRVTMHYGERGSLRIDWTGECTKVCIVIRQWERDVIGQNDEKSLL
ncbi:MAG: histidine kinase [Eubacteriales bacterium]|nr:histidine kinase [Eubacteriales bacterium]